MEKPQLRWCFFGTPLNTISVISMTCERREGEREGRGGGGREGEREGGREGRKREEGRKEGGEKDGWREEEEEVEKHSMEEGEENRPSSIQSRVEKETDTFLLLLLHCIAFDTYDWLPICITVPETFV